MGVLQKGVRVGEYVVVRKLGEGQFAEVWEVKDGSGSRVSAWCTRAPVLALGLRRRWGRMLVDRGMVHDVRHGTSQVMEP